MASHAMNTMPTTKTVRSTPTRPTSTATPSVFCDGNASYRNSWMAAFMPRG